MHQHNHCSHTLAHCTQCDVAYCTKCGREWGIRKACTQPHHPYWYVPSVLGDTTTIWPATFTYTSSTQCGYSGYSQ